MTIEHALETNELTLAYDDSVVVEDLTLRIPSGRITTIVGANACGKSTLLRGLARLMKPASGKVLLDGASIHALPTREVARVMGLLPQAPSAPEGIGVADLVGRGRYPHQGWFRQWSNDDELAVAAALEATDTLALATRAVDELSGGQRQRVWIAMALAQQTDILLLDEPITFLDVAHQIEVLDLLHDLNRRRGTTIVTVLHDLNLAARYSDHLVAMKDGKVVASGEPSRVVTEETVRTVFAMRCRVIEDPVSATPMVIPIGRRHITDHAGELPRDRGSRRVTTAVETTPALAFDVEVTGVARLSPTFARLTFGGVGAGTCRTCTHLIAHGLQVGGCSGRPTA